MTFETVHIVRRDGARCFFSADHSSIRTLKNTCSTDCHHILRCGAVRCVLFFVDNPTVWRGAFFVFYGAVRCGFFFSSILRCGAVRFCESQIVRCGAVRLNRTAPHRTVEKNRTVKRLHVFSLLCFTAAAAVSCLYHTVPQSSSQSPLCSSHGKTAVAEQVCVDHFHPCVDIAHPCVMCVL